MIEENKLKILLSSPSSEFNSTRFKLTTQTPQHKRPAFNETLLFRSSLNKTNAFRLKKKQDSKNNPSTSQLFAQSPKNNTSTSQFFGQSPKNNSNSIMNSFSSNSIYPQLNLPKNDELQVFHCGPSSYSSTAKNPIDSIPNIEKKNFSSGRYDPYAEPESPLEVDLNCESATLQKTLITLPLINDYKSNEKKDFQIISSPKNANLISLQQEKTQNFFSFYRMSPSKLELMKSFEKKNFFGSQNNGIRYHGYISEIVDKSLLPLPAVKFLIENTLLIIDYSLPKQEYGLALGKFIKQNCEQIQHVFLCKNNMSDDCISTLVETAFSGTTTKAEGILTFRYENNKIGPLLCESLKKLSKSGLFNLIEEISLSLSQFTSLHTQATLYSTLGLLPPPIKTLNLASVRLNPNNLKILCDFLLSKSSSLENLDLSDMGLRVEQIVPILDLLEGNMKNIRQLILKKNDLNDSKNRCIESILDLLHTNLKLIHLDISECNLKFKLLLPLLEFLSLELAGFQSCSYLMSLHAGGNFLTPQEKKDALNILNKNLSKKEFQIFYHHEDKSKAISNDADQNLFYQEIVSLSDKRFCSLHWPKYNKDVQKMLFSQRSIRVCMKKKIEQLNSVLQMRGDVKDSDSNLILFRFLDLNIPVCSIWFSSKNCFICERWSLQTFSSDFRFTSQVDSNFENTRTLLNDSIHHSLVINENNDESPAKGEEPTRRNFMLRSLRTMPSFSSISSILENYNDDIQINLSNDLYISFGFLKKIPLWYFVSSETNRHEFTFRFPPGTHEYEIGIFNKSITNQISIYKGTININPEMNEVTIDPSKLIQRRKKGRIFCKEYSAFKDYKIENEQITQKLFETDLSNSKLKKCLKDEESYEAVIKSVKPIYRRIKDLFYHIAAKSEYPYINSYDFSKFISDYKITDKFITRVFLDQAFAAVNAVINEVHANPSNKLCRFEFLEILVRIAYQKYMYSGRETDFNVGLNKFFENDVFSMSPNNSHQSDDFRTQKIYTIEVNDLIEANIQGLIKIYKRCKDSDNMLTFENAYILLGKCYPRSSEKPNFSDMMNLLINSKMAIIDEFKDLKNLDRLNFSEYLEFICRAADFYGNTKGKGDKSLAEKLDMFLDPYFAQLKIKKVRPIIPE